MQDESLEAVEKSPTDITKGLLAVYLVTNLTKPVTHTEIERNEIAERLNEAMLVSFDSLQSYVLLRDLRETVDVAMEKLREAALTKLGQQSTERDKKGISVFGSTVASMRLPSKWSYDHDIEHENLAAVVEKAKAALKKHEEFMRKINEPIAMTSTGTIIQPALCISDGGETLKITFPKG